MKFYSHKSMLNSCGLNTKIFLSVLVVFEKYFVFAKMSKISKTVLPCSGNLVAGKPSRMPLVVSLLNWFTRLSSGSKSQSRKRLRNFSKILSFRFLATLFGDLFESGSFSYLEVFVALFVTSSQVELPIEKNTWKNFSKFCLRCIATCLSDLYTTWYSHKKRVFCAFWLVFKNF